MDPTNPAGPASWDEAGARNRLPRTSDATNAIFADPTSRAFEARLALLAPTDATVLITGETGTGKEVAARELHARSGRKGPFLAVNCGALTESLAEAELFGHEKGAFTGALKSQAGWFEAASGGTLLLDEVGELPLALQAKLLRVLQEREITRVGSRVPRRVDARILAATNVDLEAAARQRMFRQDLLFRLSVATIELRPLRQRTQDIVPMACHFLAQYGARFGRREQHFAPDALDRLVRYPWPGNVRELDNVVHRAVLLHEGATIGVAELGLELPPPAPTTPPSNDGPQDVEGTLRRLAATWIRESEPQLLPRATSALVQAGFDAAGGNQVRAAELLGVSRNTLRTQLGHLGVIAPRRRGLGGREPGCVRVRVGTQKFGTSALLRVASDLERRLAERRILLDWREYDTGPALVASLAAGDIDIGSSGEVPPIFGQAECAPILYVACAATAPAGVALVVRAGSAIDHVPDLRGHRVALSAGANVHLLLVRALETHGLALAGIVPVYAPDGVASGPDSVPDADAWMMWDPFLSEVQARGGYRILVDGTGLVANAHFYLARRHFVHSMPDVVETVLDEALRVNAEAVQSPDETARRLAGPFGMVSEGIALAMRRLQHGSRPLDAGVMDDQQRIADEFYTRGMLPRPITVRDAVWSR